MDASIDDARMSAAKVYKVNKVKLKKAKHEKKLLPVHAPLRKVYAAIAVNKLRSAMKKNAKRRKKSLQFQTKSWRCHYYLVWRAQVDSLKSWYIYNGLIITSFLILCLYKIKDAHMYWVSAKFVRLKCSQNHHMWEEMSAEHSASYEPQLSIAFS